LDEKQYFHCKIRAKKYKTQKNFGSFNKWMGRRQFLCLRRFKVSGLNACGVSGFWFKESRHGTIVRFDGLTPVSGFNACGVSETQ